MRLVVLVNDIAPLNVKRCYMYSYILIYNTYVLGGFPEKSAITAFASSR